MEECPRCFNNDSFVLRDGRYSCRICSYEDQRRAEYELDTDCNFLDFGKSASKVMTELKRSVRKGRMRAKGEKWKKTYIPVESKIPGFPLKMYEKKYKVRVQPRERDPPGDVLPRRHEAVETWKRVTHRLSTFTQLLARTTRFIVKEKRASENVKPVTMVIFRRLLASQGIAFSDREWTDVEEDRYTMQMRMQIVREQIVQTVEDQRADMASIVASQNEGLRTGTGVGEDGMWSMLMSDVVTENLQIQAPQLMPGVRMKMKRKNIYDSEIVRTPTETSCDALARGGILMLNVELLVAISFLACALVGSRVQMADIVRWFREARIPLPPSFLHDLTKVKFWDDGKMAQLETCGYEAHFNFYLHECNSFLQRVISATRIPRRRLSIRLDEVVASHLAHLNLPFSLMERVLVVLARARVDTVDLSIDQADEEGMYCNKSTCKFGMEEGRVHPLLSTTYRSPFVTFSTDTRAMAVILLVLRLTFGLRDDRAFEVKNSPRFFNVGSWLRQLRMRMRVYGGDDGATVVSESAKESKSDYDVEWNMELNRISIVAVYQKLSYRQAARSSFPEGWKPLPLLDGDRFLYKDGLPFPEDGENRRANPSRVAMMTPLIFHGERVREKMEKRGGQMEKSHEMREAIKLIGSSFKNLEIEEASEPLVQSSPTLRRERLEEGEVAEELKHLFPAAVNFEISRLPRLSVTSLVKYDNEFDGRYVIGCGAGDAAFAFVSTAPSLSRPHRFLIQTMSRLIIEAPSVIYAATSMLERRMLRFTSCLSLVQNLESGGSVIVDDCAVPRIKGKGKLNDASLQLTRVAGEARNIIDVECHGMKVHKGNTMREKDGEKRGGGNEERKSDDGDDSEPEEEQGGDQRSRSDEENESGSEEESLVDEEIDEEEVEEEDRENNDDQPGMEGDPMEETRGEEGGGGGEMNEDEEEEEEPEERTFERYKRTHDYCRSVLQKRYYLNFDYLWSILAMRLW